MTFTIIRVDAQCACRSVPQPEPTVTTRLLIALSASNDRVEEDDDDEEEDDGDDAAGADEDEEDEDDDRDYTYKELLDRVFSKILKDRPELQDKKRTKMKPPQVAPYGSRKTIFVNFVEICSTMHREPEHCLSYLLAELGTSGSIDGQSRLVLKGRFTPKGVENNVRRYISEYVTCKMCRKSRAARNAVVHAKFAALPCSTSPCLLRPGGP
mgnify:CR=1 FL=1